MAEQRMKRRRSECEDNQNNNTQRKCRVNERMVDASNAERMQAVYARTKEMLFKGAAASTDAKNTITAQTKQAGCASAAEKLCDLYQLAGDGTIALRKLKPDASNPSLELRKSQCCRRLTLIKDNCVNCTVDLCEECGYSCRECKQFICRSCVTLFGNQPAEVETPLCERCQMFCA